MSNSLAILILINIAFTAIVASVTIFNIYYTQANSYQRGITIVSTINGKLDSITHSLANVLQNLTTVTVHLVNNTQAINATLHGISHNITNTQGNLTKLTNETGFQARKLT